MACSHLWQLNSAKQYLARTIFEWVPNRGTFTFAPLGYVLRSTSRGSTSHSANTASQKTVFPLSFEGSLVLPVIHSASSALCTRAAFESSHSQPLRHWEKMTLCIRELNSVTRLYYYQHIFYSPGLCLSGATNNV